MLMPHLDIHARVLLLICFSLTLVLLVVIRSKNEILLPTQLLQRGVQQPIHGVTNADTDLLRDVSNSTLGVRLYSSHYRGPRLTKQQFQKIFVLGLPSRTDRRDSMSLAAAYSGLDIEYIDGVTAMSDKALPPGRAQRVEKAMNERTIYAWRAHMNVLRRQAVPLCRHELGFATDWLTCDRIVEDNITSALILEDDVDWDIRIKSQMTQFARASQLLVQPLTRTSDQEQYLDPTYPKPSAEQGYTDLMLDEHSASEPTVSPYGDLSRWDLLWLGHCGCRFPRASDENAPLGRIVIANDTTVPEHKDLNMELGNNELLTQYPANTRVVSRARVNSCTLAYAVSQPGARKLLYELGVHKMSDALDTMLRYVCDGVDDRQQATCLTVQPQLLVISIIMAMPTTTKRRLTMSGGACV